jgi:hypothetical protein
LPISKKRHFGEGITKEDMAKLQWLNPKLVAQVSFTEWTHSGLLRHATFLGLRDDKDPKEVMRERPNARGSSLSMTRCRSESTSAPRSRKGIGSCSGGMLFHSHLPERNYDASSVTRPTKATIATRARRPG